MTTPITDQMVELAEADATRLVTRDHIARTLAVSFYGRGGDIIYDASLEKVVEARWHEWRPQADDLLRAYAIFHRRAAISGSSTSAQKEE